MSIWSEFYKSFDECSPSPFAIWVKTLNPPTPIIDLGCGNGRDTKFLNCVGVDVANLPNKDFEYIQEDVEKFISTPCKYETVYSRFFFHSIPPELVEKIIKWNTGLLIAEFRVVGDEPLLYTDHKRWFVDIGWLNNALEGYDRTIYVGRGYAPYKNEDPLIGRIVARRIKK